MRKDGSEGCDGDEGRGEGDPVLIHIHLQVVDVLGVAGVVYIEDKGHHSARRGTHGGVVELHHQAVDPVDGGNDGEGIGPRLVIIEGPGDGQVEGHGNRSIGDGHRHLDQAGSSSS